MINFIAVRTFQDAYGHPAGKLEIICTFTSLLSWMLIFDEQYLVMSFKSFKIYRYDNRTSSLYVDGMFMRRGITMEEAQEFVLSDPAIKEEGIHPHYVFTAKDVISEVFLA